MCLAAALVGEATCWISKVAKVNISERLAVMSSLAAVAIGVLWTLSAAVKCFDNNYQWWDSEHTPLFSAISGSGGSNNMYNTDHIEASLGNNDNFALHLGGGSSTMNMNINNNNDNFQNSSFGTQLEMVLSCGSVVAVIGVIVGAIYYEFGTSCTGRFITISKAPIHRV